MANRRKHPHGLKLSDFADHELFYALEAVADEEGWATAEDIAAEIGIDAESPAKNVGSRLSWMNRYGFMEKDMETIPDDDGKKIRVTRWRLNDKAYDLIHPEELSEAVNKALARMSEGQRAEVTRAIARELPRGSRQSMHLARRTWTHHTGGWRDKTITPKARK